MGVIFNLVKRMKDYVKTTENKLCFFKKTHASSKKKRRRLRARRFLLSG
jgi:hypothetical protein